eukprot:COSAG02_NODE_36_length_48934_cov_144.851029_23_plen_544_part_00
MVAAAARTYDVIVCGSGPGAAAWLRSALRHAPRSRILLLERGPYCKTDVLTETNPLTLLRDSRRVVARYEHGVMQGSTLGGSTAINNYAFTMPAYSDLRAALGVNRDAYTEAMVGRFESMCEDLIGPREPPHMLHQLLTSSRPEGVGLVSNDRLRVQESNQNQVFIGTPTLNSAGERRSAWTGMVEPLWREYLRNVHVITDTTVCRVLFQDCPDGGEPRAIGVESTDGSVIKASTVVLACGCLETPAVLMRSGIGPASHLRERNVRVVVDNAHVGQHLKDKMVLDDMIITDCTVGDHGKSLLLVNRVFEHLYTQQHRYDKWTFGNSYLALTRLLRGAWHDLGRTGGGSLLTAARHWMRYCSPKGNVAFCFQNVIKMQREGSVTLSNDAQRSAHLDASALFQEVVDQEAELKEQVKEAYASIRAMRDSERIQYQMTDESMLLSGKVGPHLRMGWQFAGTCRVDDVIDAADFGVIGVRGVHVADMSACRVSPDISCMAMAYMVGHIAAAHMLRAQLVEEHNGAQPLGETEAVLGYLRAQTGHDVT